MPQFKTNDGFLVTVDPIDFKWASQLSWRCVPGGYVRHSYWNSQNERPCYQMLHLEILKRMGFVKFEETDHINRDVLDNRRENLRAATRQQNLCNRAKFKTNKSGYKGVYWNKRSMKWHAQLTTKGVKKHLGFFTDIKEAAKAYNEAALKYHGEFAYINEIKD